jgi:hypothetical protein
VPRLRRIATTVDGIFVCISTTSDRSQSDLRPGAVFGAGIFLVLCCALGPGIVGAAAGTAIGGFVGIIVGCLFGAIVGV